MGTNFYFITQDREIKDKYFNYDDYTIDVNKIESLITDKTVAIVPVHVYGNVCNVEKIKEIADKYNLKVVYDAAHAFGVKYNGVSVGNFGDLSMFSFHATKVFNTIEGGAVTYHNAEFKQKLNNLKNFGIIDEEHMLCIAGNAKMNEFQAAMGLCNLKHLDENDKKNKIKYYSRGCRIKLCIFSNSCRRWLWYK